ncbi:MAG: hypothetical protein ACRCWG_15555 [Sarcina sp.]
MSKGKKILVTILSIIVALIIATIITYYVSFSPKVATTPVTSNIQINELNLIKKFIPTDVNLNLKGITAKSDAQFSSQELTDLAIYAVNQSPEAKQYVTGLQVKILDGNVIIYITVNYKGIPFEGKLVFEPYAKDGKGILHYVSGNIGFIQIPKNIIFNSLVDNPIIHFNKTVGDIILHFDNLGQIQIENISTKDDNIDIMFKGSINLF